MKRISLKKFLLLSICCVLLVVSSFGFFGCGRNSNKLKEKCKIVFDYLSARGWEVQFYQIDELSACNKNIYTGNKNFFDVGEVYKITTYRYNASSGTNVSFEEYFFGTLNGQPVLYQLWQSGANWILSRQDI